MSAVKACLACIALVGLAAMSAPPPRGYFKCADDAAIAYGDDWALLCHSLGREAEGCELSNAEVHRIERKHTAARRACLNQFRPARPNLTPRWWHNESKGLTGSVLAAPKRERPRFRDWLISTLVVSACLIGILNLIRSPRDD